MAAPISQAGTTMAGVMFGMNQVPLSGWFSGDSTPISKGSKPIVDFQDLWGFERL